MKRLGLRGRIRLALVALVAGCSSEYRGSSAGAPKLGAANDLNPRDPSTLKDGGNLRLGAYHPRQ